MADIIHYRGYQIRRALDSLMPQTDWAYGHVDFDGAPDANDNRYGHAAFIEDCKAEIDERLDE